MANCFGNNPAAPYVVPMVQSWPEEFVDPATANALGRTRPGYSSTYRLDPREAIVVLGELPPQARYFGLQSWVFAKQWLTPTSPWVPAAYDFFANRAPDLVDYLFTTVPNNGDRLQSFSSVSNNINNIVIAEQSGAAFGQTRYFPEGDTTAPGQADLLGKFSAAVRAYVKPGTARGPDPALQLRPRTLTFHLP